MAMTAGRRALEHFSFRFGVPRVCDEVAPRVERGDDLAGRSLLHGDEQIVAAHGLPILANMVGNSGHPPLGQCDVREEMMCTPPCSWRSLG
jgi:hypothetical protein